jgi:hypothetical protein
MLPPKEWQHIIFTDTLVVVLCSGNLYSMFLTKKCILEQVKHFTLTAQQSETQKDLFQ